MAFKRDGEARINYQERAPLVIPPGHDLLPEPERSVTPQRQSGLAEGSRTWSAASAKRPRSTASATRPTNASASKILCVRISWRRALAANRRRQPGPTTAIKRLHPASAAGCRPSELGYTGGLFGAMFGKKKEEQAKFTGEPPRTSLTEPPSGYQTPSPDQPYGLAKGVAPKKAYNDYYRPRRPELKLAENCMGREIRDLVHVLCSEGVAPAPAKCKKADPCRID